MLHEFLEATNYVDFHHTLIQAKIAEIKEVTVDEDERVLLAYHFVRDDITHSWDAKRRTVTQTASQTIKEQTGICYAKANLLAALLRGLTIPTGFCYQRLMLFNTPEQGYCIHALNAIYSKKRGRWIKVDARGNKEGIYAELNWDKEQLAFQTNEMKGEQLYPTIFSSPNIKTMKVLAEAHDALLMYRYSLPDNL